MKYVSRNMLGFALTLLAGLYVGYIATASAKEETEMTAVPTNSADIWKLIDTRVAQLKTTIDSGHLDEVHHQAFAIRDFVAALPAHSKSLSADQLGKVRGGVKFVSTLAERLDASGDAKDVAGTKQNYAKLVAVLTSLRSNYSTAK